MKILITEKQSELLNLRENKNTQTKTYLVTDPSDPSRSFQVRGPYELIYGRPVELAIDKVYKANQEVEIVYYVANLSENPLSITSVGSIYKLYKAEFTKDPIPKNYQGLISISFKIGPYAKGDLVRNECENTMKFKFGDLPPSLKPLKPNNPFGNQSDMLYTNRVAKNTNKPEINKLFYFSYLAPGTLTFFVGASNKSQHLINTLWSMGALIIPFVGPYISIGFQLYDAKLYNDEGKKQEAGLCLMFAMLPGVWSILKRIPFIKKWSAKALARIGQKIVNNETLTAGETQVAQAIAANKEFVEQETLKQMANSQLVSTAAKEVASLPRTSKGLVDGMNKFSVTFLTYGGAAYTYNKSYKYVFGDDPPTIAEKLGMDWEMLRKIFGSDNSKEDNQKFVNAVKDGWRPGMVVPEKYRTKTWHQLYDDEF